MRRDFGGCRLAGLVVLSMLLIGGFTTATLAHETDQEMPLGGVSTTIKVDQFTGQLTGSIPIEIPPGRNGMQPQIALTYSNTSGNGWVGKGWKLDEIGISRSTRFGLNYAGEGDGAYTVKLAGMSGELVVAPPPSTPQEYRNKIEMGFTRYQQIGTGASVSWIATTRDGRKLFFGQSQQSRIRNPANTAQIFSWLLDRVEDVDGNYMELSYVRDQEQLYLNEIRYTGFAGSLLPTNKLTFVLENRPDSIPSYATNFRIVTAKRLKRIEVRADSALQRAYELTYGESADSHDSLLASIRQLDRSGLVTAETPPPATFEYTTGASTFVYSPVNGQGLVWDWGTAADPPKDVQVGDINGDGLADVIFMAQNDSLPAIAVSLNSNGSSFTENSGANSPGCSRNPTEQRWIGLADFDGDGKSEFWCFSNSVNQSFQGLYVYKWNGTALQSQGRWLQVSGLSKPPFLGDANGDGKADFIVSSSVGVSVHLGLGTGFAAQSTTWYGFPWCQNGSEGLTDMNGDQKGDLTCISATAGVTITLSTGNGFETSPTPWLPGPIPNPNSDSAPNVYFLTDVTGDGKSDLLVVDHNDVRVARSNGQSLAALQSWGQLGDLVWCLDFFVEAREYSSTDLDGDGTNDLACVNLGAKQLWVARANRTTATFGSTTPDLLSQTLNGIGGSVAISYIPSTQTYNHQIPFPVQLVDRLKEGDGRGNLLVKRYSYLNGFYYGPERDFRGFASVTEALYSEVSDQLVGTGKSTQSHFHQGNDWQIDQNNPDVPHGYMKGKPYRIRVSAFPFTTIETTTLYRSDTSPPWFTPIESVVTRVTTGIPPSTKRTRIDYQYDEFGNVMEEDDYGDLDVTGDERTILRTFSANTNAWILGLPSSETIREGIGTEGNQKVKTEYLYDGFGADCSSISGTPSPTKGHATVMTKRNLTDPTKDHVVKLAYDNYGNRTCIWIPSGVPAGSKTTVIYDSTFQTFPIGVTNALGHQIHTEMYGVNPNPSQDATAGLYGQTQMTWDPNNASVLMKYDSFGREILRQADGTSPISTTWTCVGCGIGTQSARVLVGTGSEALLTTTYFDGLGRTFKKEQTGPSQPAPTTIVTETDYNVTGTIKRISTPRFTTETNVLWTAMQYDPLERLIRVDLPSPSGQSIRTLTCYADWATVIIDANNHKKRETRDAYGRLVRVDEYTGTFTSCSTLLGTPYATTHYEYDVLGNLTKVIDKKGNVTTMRYDSLGRKIAMSDPDMGHCGDLMTTAPNTDYPWYPTPCWNYQYDAAGNLISQTDAKGQEITFLYDILNRRVRKTTPSGNTTYTYDMGPAASNLKGRRYCQELWIVAD